ncbi:MAG: glycosyltransferase family 4 protein [Pyrinomonadaceae bacterium]
MRVLYLHQHLAIRKGSIGTRSFEFARLLRQRSHEVTMLCGRNELSGLPSGERLIERHEIDGIPIIQLNVPYSQGMGFARRFVAFVWFMLLATFVAMRERNVDLIYATSTPLTIAVPAMIGALVKRRPFVFEVRDLWPEVPIGLGLLRNPVLITVAKLLARLTYRRACRIVACSPGMKDGIVRGGVSAAKVVVIPNGCDADLFDVPEAIGRAFRAEHSYLKDRPLVVYTGAFGMVNGVDYLVRLAHRLQSRGKQVSFLLVGEGSEKERVRELAEKLEVLGRSLWILEAVSREQTAAVLSAATIATSTVIPNSVLWNNSANKFFDALAAGRPVMVNHGGWLAELLIQTGIGIVVSAEDFDSAADVLTEFLESEARLKAARIAARRLARDQFARTRLAARLEEVLVEASCRMPIGPNHELAVHHD